MHVLSGFSQSTEGLSHVDSFQHKAVLLEDKKAARVDEVSQDVLVLNLNQLDIGSSNDFKAFDRDITSSESQFTDSQGETSDSVAEACDYFFHEERVLENEKIDAAVEKTFRMIVGAQNLGEVNPEEIKEAITDSFNNLNSDNTEHHFILNDCEFHFSLVTDVHNVQQIEIYQKIGELGEGAFGKVSEFKQLDNGNVYASKLASPRDGLPLYEAEDYYSQVLDWVQSVESQLQNATDDAVQAELNTELQGAKVQLNYYRSLLEESRAAEKDIKKEIKNQKLYNPNPLKSIIGIQPRYHKFSTNLGVRYMIEKGVDGNELFNKLDVIFSEKIKSSNKQESLEYIEKQNQFNKLVTQTLVIGLEYMTLEKGMCHSDIKPGNVLYTGGGELLTDNDFRIYHADFGGDISIKTIISKLSNPLNTIPIPKLMISSGAYTSSKMIFAIEALSQSIKTKVKEGQLDIEEDQARMKDLIIQSCRFSLGITLFELFIGRGPYIEAFDEGGMLFGTNSAGKSVYQENLQILYEDLSFYMSRDVETRETILNLLGLGRCFDIIENEVVLT